ncbi:MAG: Gfo/Idh/MocA family oxidoreductase [Parasphingorhabdus sp.]|nr:Gfo/Idh/MocA family oxidoreductase [Parasphingorhabdus sp.]
MTFRWAIFGTGLVSGEFVAGLKSVPGAHAAVVASRSQSRAEAFAAAHAIETVHTGYDPAPLVGKVDAVYIATPTALHAEHSIACLSVGLPVLIEKPLAATGEQAEAIAAAAQRAGLFAMEAMWTRFLPALEAVQAAIAAGQIGTIRLIQGSFGISNAPDPARPLFDPQMAGGALRQYGVYPLSLAAMFAGPATRICATGSGTATGVDASVAMAVAYESGATGSFACALDATLDNDFAVHGSAGTIRLAGPIYRPSGYYLQAVNPRKSAEDMAGGIKARLRNHPAARALKQRIQRSSALQGRFHGHLPDGNGYGHEAAEVMRAIAAGMRESPRMPLAQSVALAKMTDDALAQIGVGR